MFAPTDAAATIAQGSETHAHARRLPTVPLGALRRLARHALHATRSDGEPFDADRLDKRDTALVAALEHDLGALSRAWLGLTVEGEEHIAGRPCVYVANHNGGIMGPDLFCTMHVLWQRLGAHTPLYAMAHDFAMAHVHPLGRMLQRIGGLRATPDNARRVLDSGASLLVYPGGDLDAYRHFERRNEVVFGQRTGFVKIARDAGVPIVPIVAQGAHRSAIILHEGEWIAQALGLTRWSRLRRFPIAVALPWGIAPGPWMPYLPLPFPIQLRILPALEVPPDSALTVVRDEVVARMQTAMDSLTEKAR
ncbi:MAG: 1-acyl-sn-glycerol-3-phosphate acyltransferase [Deltaproteobacteria bacterium]|nr:1-acyl-sn-glycerol-3-phosphate acyltransferase [Deltaproteobacteria bacterium]